MSAELLWDNVLAYSLQIGALVCLSAAIPALVRLAEPRARLAFWYLVLGACLLLPVVQPWRHRAVTALPVLKTAPPRPQPPMPESTPWPLTEAALAGVALGICARAGWLGVGLLRLRRHRRSARPLEPVPSAVADLRKALAPNTLICVSGEVPSPVTFGLLRPVVLLPAQFPELPSPTQQAIACHELLHVARRDWLYTVAEELVRAVLWFHPAVWWVLGKVQLSREQAVDREVVVMTEARHEYVDALLAIAGARPRLDLAPAPLFLRKRHLKQRVMSILQEGSMSTRRLAAAMAAGLGMLVAACWLAIGAFPLAASPQAVTDAAGVTVETGGVALAHRAPVAYPEAALRKRIQGTIVVEATLDADGVVTDARVVAGPDELRRAALHSVLEWHFDKRAGPGVRQVSIGFQLPPEAPEAAAAQLPMRRLAVMPPGMDSLVVRRIAMNGLSAEAQDALRGHLPVSVGAPMTNDALLGLQKTVRDYDEHLGVGLFRVNGSNEVDITIAPGPGIGASMAAAAPPSGAKDSPTRIRVGGNLQQSKIVSKVQPNYPPLAKQARIQGTVRLQVLIDPQGSVANIQVESGHPLLVPPAVDAVKQWTYAPTLLNGNPVEVLTVVDVNFTLSE